MSMIARQFGRPHGLVGPFIGRAMARSNADFNQWFVAEIGRRIGTGPSRVAEIGPGPGVGLQRVLSTFNDAHVWGIDLSPQMLAQSRRRNRDSVRMGRLVLLEGDARRLQELAPLDLVLASHVLYFWRRPSAEIAMIKEALRPGGHLALGYQLKANMPQPAQDNFPRAGYSLYENDDAVITAIRSAGFETVDIAVKGPADRPEGRLALAHS